MPNIFHHMQSAVEAAQTSAHPTSKVGTCLISAEGKNITSPNFWPAPIKTHIGTQTRIGNASGTIHAETACLLHAPFATNGASVFSTDPSCPNCAKNMAEAGITHLYIDHKGFEKYYAKTRTSDFENLTLPICEAAGMGVSKVFRKEERVEVIIEERHYTVYPGNPSMNHPNKSGDDEESVFVLCKTSNNKELKVFAGPVLGNTTIQDTADSKYNPLMQPLTRLLMMTARDNLTINPASITSSRIPTSRELVNFIGAGFDTLTILDKTNARDEYAFEALQLLQNNKILNIS